MQNKTAHATTGLLYGGFLQLLPGHFFEMFRLKNLSYWQKRYFYFLIHHGPFHKKLYYL